MHGEHHSWVRLVLFCELKPVGIEKRFFNGWNGWLARATRPMPAWELGTLAALKNHESNPPIVDVSIPTEPAADVIRGRVVIYQNPELRDLQSLVETARTQLAEVETAFSVEKRKVDAIRAKPFAKLRAHYEKRDRLRLVVQYRKSFIEKLLRSGEDEANEVREQFKQAEAETKRAYESTAATLENKRELTAAEEQELKTLWKTLESSNALPKMLPSVSFQEFGMHVFGTNICDNQRCRHSGSTWMCTAGSKMQQQSIAGNAPFPRTHSSVC